MNNIVIIAAVGKNLELGKNNKLIWHFKEDMKFFKNQTMNKPIVMGYKTFESLPKLLTGRKHIVITNRNLNLGADIIVIHSIDEILDLACSYPEVMIIGGAMLYQEMLPHCNKLILTEVDAIADADVYFPTFDKRKYNCEVISENKENNISYKHLIYTKK